jgi:hypothetical protein
MNTIKDSVVNNEKINRMGRLLDSFDAACQTFQHSTTKQITD